MNNVYRWTPLLARILISLIFITSGFGKLTHLTETSAHIAQAGLPMPYVAALIAGLVELGGGLGILFGCGTRCAAATLFLFLIPVTYCFHNPIGLVGAIRMTQQTQLVKNLAIMGGLLMLFGFGPGPGSVDARRRPRGLFANLFGERPLGA